MRLFWAEGATSAKEAIRLGKRIRAQLRGGMKGRGLHSSEFILKPRPLYVGPVASPVPSDYLEPR